MIVLTCKHFNEGPKSVDADEAVGNLAETLLSFPLFKRQGRNPDFIYPDTAFGVMGFINFESNAKRYRDYDLLPLLSLAFFP